MHESRIANQIEKVYKFRDPTCHWRHKLKYVFDFDLLVDQTFLKIISEKIKRGLIFFWLHFNFYMLSQFTNRFDGQA
jgi:hypothetical protein